MPFSKFGLKKSQIGKPSDATGLNRFNIKFFRHQHQKDKTVIKTFFIKWLLYCTSTTAS